MIKHVVMWKFKAEAEGQTKAQNMDQLAEALLALRPIIPELESMEIGQDLGIGREPFDMVLITTFADADALDRYQHHPAHKAVSAFCARIRDERATVDFEFDRI